MRKPVEELVGIEAGGTDDARSRGQGGGQGGRYPAPVKQRHEIQTSILGRERQGASDIGARVIEAALRDGYELWLRGRSRGEKDHAVALEARGTFVDARRRRGRRTRCLRPLAGPLELEDGESELTGHARRHGLQTAERQQHLRTRPLEHRAQLRSTKRGIEGKRHRRTNHSQKGHRKLRAIGPDDGDSIGARQPAGGEPCGKRYELMSQLCVRERRVAGSSDRDRLGGDGRHGSSISEWAAASVRSMRFASPWPPAPGTAAIRDSRRVDARCTKVA